MEMHNRETSVLHTDTLPAVLRERARQERRRNKPAWAGSNAPQRWKLAIDWVCSRSKRHYQDHLGVTCREHMSEVDCFNGERARAGRSGTGPTAHGDLITISPTIDGRLKDEARQ